MLNKEEPVLILTLAFSTLEQTVTVPRACFIDLVRCDLVPDSLESKIHAVTQQALPGHKFWVNISSLMATTSVSIGGIFTV